MSEIIHERYIKFDDVDYDRYNQQNQDFPAGGSFPFIIPKKDLVYDFIGFQKLVLVGSTNLQNMKIKVLDYSFGGVNSHTDKIAYIQFEVCKEVEKEES